MREGPRDAIHTCAAEPTAVRASADQRRSFPLLGSASQPARESECTIRGEGRRMRSANRRRPVRRRAQRGRRERRSARSAPAGERPTDGTHRLRSRRSTRWKRGSPERSRGTPRSRRSCTRGRSPVSWMHLLDRKRVGHRRLARRPRGIAAQRRGRKGRLGMGNVSMCASCVRGLDPRAGRRKSRKSTLSTHSHFQRG
jgi:hypothetical protein